MHRSRHQDPQGLQTSHWQRTPKLLLFLYSFFFLFLIAQHSVVFMYHDDWGYAVLDYVRVQEGFVGQQFTFSHAFSFLAESYEPWTGRIFPIFLQIYLHKPGLWFIRFFQILVVLGVVFVSLWISVRPPEQTKPQLLPHVTAVLLYFSLPPGLLIDGIYWFAAAANYLWGVPIFLLGAYLVLISRRITICAALLLGLSATFHEQMACAAIAFLVSCSLYDHFFKITNQTALAKIFLSLPVALLTLATGFRPFAFPPLAGRSNVGKA